jgi:hypothetical protein
VAPQVFHPAEPRIGRSNSPAHRRSHRSNAPPAKEGDPPDDSETLRLLAERVERLVVELADQSVRLKIRLDRIEAHVAAVEQRSEQARSIALDAMDLAGDQ